MFRIGFQVPMEGFGRWAIINGQPRLFNVSHMSFVCSIKYTSYTPYYTIVTGKRMVVAVPCVLCDGSRVLTLANGQTTPCIRQHSRTVGGFPAIEAVQFHYVRVFGPDEFDYVNEDWHCGELVTTTYQEKDLFETAEEAAPALQAALAAWQERNPGIPVSEVVKD